VSDRELTGRAVVPNSAARETERERVNRESGGPQQCSQRDRDEREKRLKERERD
jgi:hypothetical protein